MKSMSDESRSPSSYRDSPLDPAVLTMIADNLDERANTLQSEAKRLSDEAEQLREMAQETQDK